MTAFADEARSRTAWLLRMASPDQDAGSIIEYATSTPEPPLMGPHGIRTRGCPRCRRTMWMQREMWICASCGHMEDVSRHGEGPAGHGQDPAGHGQDPGRQVRGDGRGGCEEEPGGHGETPN